MGEHVVSGFKPEVNCTWTCAEGEVLCSDGSCMPTHDEHGCHNHCIVECSEDEQLCLGQAGHDHHEGHEHDRDFHDHGDCAEPDFCIRKDHFCPVFCGEEEILCPGPHEYHEGHDHAEDHEGHGHDHGDHDHEDHEGHDHDRHEHDHDHDEHEHDHDHEGHNHDHGHDGHNHTGHYHQIGQDFCIPAFVKILHVLIVVLSNVMMMNKLVQVDLILMVVPMMIFAFLLMNFVHNIVKKLKCGVLDLMIPYPEKQLGPILVRLSMTKTDVTIIAPYIALKMRNW